MLKFANSLARYGRMNVTRRAWMSGLVREESFEKSLPNDVREFVSEAFDIFDPSRNFVLFLLGIEKVFPVNFLGTACCLSLFYSLSA